MIRKREDTDDAVAKAMGVMASELESGSGIVRHIDLADAIGVPYPSERYYQVAMMARKRFRESTGVWTNPVPSVGFRLQTPDQSLTEEQTSRRRRAHGQLRIATKVAKAIPDERLTEHQRKVKNHTIDSNARIEKDMRFATEFELMMSRPSSGRGIRVEPPRT